MQAFYALMKHKAIIGCKHFNGMQNECWMQAFRH